MKIALLAYTDYPSWEPTLTRLPDFISEEEEAGYKPNGMHRVSNVLEITFRELSKEEQAAGALVALEQLEDEAQKEYMDRLKVIHTARKEYLMISYQPEEERK
jgi:hypothetical protein